MNKINEFADVNILNDQIIKYLLDDNNYMKKYKNINKNNDSDTFIHKRKKIINIIPNNGKFVNKRMKS